MAGKSRARKKIFKHKMKKRLVVIYLIITLALLFLLGKIGYMQKEEGDNYVKKVLSSQIYNSRTIPFKRGDITDRKGTVLATSVDVYNVILDCKVINSKQERYLKPTVAALTQYFDITEEEIKGILDERPDSQYYVLRKRLPFDEIAEFQKMLEDKKKYPDIAGVWFEKQYKRNYPYGTLASSVLGFTTSSNEGIGGLENYYNNILNGANGREYGYLNTDSDVEKTIVEATDGNTVVTTIDENIQAIVEEKILAFNQQYANNAREGNGSTNTGVIIMDPNNAEVLAMADYPNYDLNHPWDLTPFFPQEQIDAMSEEQRLDALNKVWQNYCITHTYEPGSTFKPFTVAAGLETGTMNGGEVYVCDGVEKIGEHDIHCVVRSGHGQETVEKALMDSCNDALMQMSYVIGNENFCKYQNIFNFGLRTNIDLPGEARTDTLIYNAEDMGVASLATNSFGQNFNATMIQMATAFSSLINGGYYYQPHIVKEIKDENGNTVEKTDRVLLKETVSRSTSDKMRAYLYKVTSEGTAITAKIPGYSMGGKTGTAQKQPRSANNYLVSFIGYAPQENPQLLIYVVIDEPNVEDQAHSVYAQQLAHDILMEVLPYMNIYQDEEPTPEQLQNEAENNPGAAGESTLDVPDQVPQDPGAETDPQAQQDLLDQMEQETGQQ